uniref:pleckstrin homology-like domain family A member 1 n=1 Tax=Osmia lignaria TaxID=473952 RepID=UPI0014791887|nr:pleckstrin homology-like domain family A member 1 [Osmia lignaria]
MFFNIFLENKKAKSLGAEAQPQPKAQPQRQPQAQPQPHQQPQPQPHQQPQPQPHQQPQPQPQLQQDMQQIKNFMHMLQHAGSTSWHTNNRSRTSRRHNSNKQNILHTYQWNSGSWSGSGSENAASCGGRPI